MRWKMSQPGHEITMRLCDFIMLTHRASSSSALLSLSLSPYKDIFSLPLVLLFFLSFSLSFLPSLFSLINCDSVYLALTLSIHADNLISIILLTIPEQFVKAPFSKRKLIRNSDLIEVIKDAV